MEIKRKIYQKLLKWKEETNGSKALFLEGARRIGKSTIAKKFAQNEYDSFVLIDFNNVSKKIKDNFDNLNNLDLFFQTISLEYNTKLYNRKSVIIFYFYFFNFTKYIRLCTIIFIKIRAIYIE